MRTTLEVSQNTTSINIISNNIRFRQKLTLLLSDMCNIEFGGIEINEPYDQPSIGRYVFIWIKVVIVQLD